MQAEALEREAKRRRVDSAELASMRVRPPYLTTERHPNTAAQALGPHSCCLGFCYIPVHTWQVFLSTYRFPGSVPHT